MTLLEAISPTTRHLLRSKVGRDSVEPSNPIPSTARQVLDRVSPPRIRALSIRQPWAWLIVNGYKPVENREWVTHFRGEFLIHSGATMTKDDYAACMIFIAPIKRRGRVPAYDVLRQQCGGIVGQATLVDCVTDYDSDWFTGPYGFVLKYAKPLPFAPCKGALNFFIPPTL